MEPVLRNAEEMLGSETVYTKQQRIAELARQMPGAQLWSLSRHIDLEWMAEAYRRTRKDGAAGVDAVTAQEYERDLTGNLNGLLERFKSGTYVAPPVKRVYIPKDEGAEEFRPIGIPTLEDKVLQRAVVMVLEPMYEQEFLSCSYGFRPKRSVHQAVEELWQVLMAMGGGWVYEVDIRKFFDTVKPEHIRTMLSKRVGDGVIRRTVGKWLKAGVWEDGAIHYPEEGTPQGGVISPLLSNIYLHVVLDKWFEDEVKPLLRGKARLIRFADDYVIVFERKDDAERVGMATPKRFARFGLTINEQKTRIVDFRMPVIGRENRGVFDFLGFTHYWAKSRRGAWVVKRKTAAKKLRKAVGKVYRKCQRDRHKPVKEQWESLCRTVRGHYGFYGITFNIEGLKQYFEAVKRAWRKWLNRRSRDKDMPWERFTKLLDRYPLPSPRVVHSYV